MVRASDYVSFVLWLPRAANGEPHFVWVRVALGEWINGAVPAILTLRFRQLRQGLVSQWLSLNNKALAFVSDSNLANLYQQLTNLKCPRIDRGACLRLPLQLLSDAQQRVLLRQAWSLNFQLPYWAVSPTEYGVILLPVKLWSLRLCLSRVSCFPTFMQRVGQYTSLNALQEEYQTKSHVYCYAELFQINICSCCRP